jgi:hypothetical protein
LEAKQARIDEISSELEQLQSELSDAREATEKTRAELEKARAELAKPALEPRPEEPKEWYLRYDAENMLGPVSFDDLIAWAKDCRVAPDHDVSSDKIFWAKASDVPDLEMEWMVTLVDGTEYGPINKYAIDDLIADEAVTVDAELTHCRTGEKINAASVRQE